MKFSEIKENNILPFEVEDRELQLLFSFFLHKAPTIDSYLALKSNKNSQKWNDFIRDWKKEYYKFYSKFPSDNKLEQYKLTEKDRAFVCVKKDKKDKKESDYECFVRHLRNAIAHGYVFMKKQKNRIFVLLEDYNKNGNHTAIILVSKSDLKKLKKEMEKDI